MAETPELTGDGVEASGRNAAEEGHSDQDEVMATSDCSTTAEDAQFRTTVASIVERDRELIDRLAQ